MTMESKYTLQDLVDLDRYPIDDLDGRGRDLVAQGRAHLSDHAMCHLPGFLRPEAVETVLEEIASIRDTAYWMEVPRRAYSWRNPNDYPHAPVVGRANKNRIGTITTDAFAETSAFVALSNQPALTEFIRRCMGFESLHLVACPFLAANIKVMEEGSSHAWHFDQNDGAVTFLFENAERGGHFEYVPFLRDEDDERYEEVERLMDGETSRVLTAPLEPGSFCLFMGRRSIHRVSDVEQGNPDRLLAVFSYHRNAGHRYRESTVRSVLGRLPDNYEQTLP